MDELTLGMTIEKQNSNLEELSTKVGALEEELIHHREVGNDNVDKVNDFMKKTRRMGKAIDAKLAFDFFGLLLIGGISYLHNKRIEKLEVKQRALYDTVIEVECRVDKIEGELSTLDSALIHSFWESGKTVSQISMCLGISESRVTSVLGIENS